MNDNILMENAITFAAKIIKLREQLIAEKGEILITDHIAESAAKIGVLVSEANYAKSRAEHIDKLRDALTKAAETEYWIKLLYTAEYIDFETHGKLIEDCMDVKRNVIAAVNGAREK